MTDATPLFDPERMRVYPRMAVAVYLAAAIGIVVSSTSLIDIFGKPLGYDFITFWGASWLTLHGHAANAFDMASIFAAERVAVPANEQVFLWHYPPPFQLVVAPLALLPYALSWFLFVGVSLAAYVLTLRPLVRLRGLGSRDAVFLLFGFSGAFICAFHGQNSTISAALFAGAALAIERRPALAGALLGLLAFKPQLALLVPLALLAGRQWRAFLAAGASALLFSAIATLVFGIDLWVVFFKNAPHVSALMESGQLRWEKMPSAYVFIRMLGLSDALAHGAQALCALASAGVVAGVWWRKGAAPLSFAVLIPASLLALPYSFDYEFALLAVPIAILASDMVERGASRAEKLTLPVLYAGPVVVAPVALATHFQIGFVLLLLALWVAARRALAPGAVELQRHDRLPCGAMGAGGGDAEHA